MKKIILIDDRWDFNSPLLQYALRASKNTDTEIVGIFLIDDRIKGTIEKAETTLRAVRQAFTSEGVNFSSHVMGADADAFLKGIDGLMPVSLVLIGDVKFSEEMVKRGISVEALKGKLTCPVTTIEAIAGAHAEKKHAAGINWGAFIMYLIGSIIIYGVFFPMIKNLNATIFMKGNVLGAIAIMVVSVVTAWVWGNTTHILPKLFKLEK
ncbi:MAG: hypothetical protein AAB089_02350 [Nitrospirota bacterium]